MKQIISVSLASSADDYEFHSSFMGHDFRIRRIGVDGDEQKARQLLLENDAHSDAISIGDVPYPFALSAPHYTAQRKAILDRLREGLKTPTFTGEKLRRIGEEWSIRHIQFELGDSYFNNMRVLFVSGRINYHLARALSEYTDNLSFADAMLEADHPTVLGSLPALERYARPGFTLGALPGKWLGQALPPFRHSNRRRLRKAARSHFVLVVPNRDFYEYLNPFSEGDLKEKIVISASITDDRMEYLSQRGVDTIIDTTPMILERPVKADVLEALMFVAVEHPEPTLTQDDLLEVISRNRMVPRLVYPSGKPKRKNRFAFVIHPLSQEHLKKEKTINMVMSALPKWCMNAVETLAAYLPAFMYCKVTGVKSPEGVEAEGWLISVGGTPKQMLSHSPEFTYKRLLGAAKIAKKMGAQIMGLGAFTKVVGDAGITVAKLAPLPITTGNSYSASGALWAAADAARRMGLLEITKGKRLKGKAMVVGATGAIGSVCCRLLAFAFEEIYMIDVRDARLLALRESILQETPDVEVHVSTRADKYLADMDVIVTATSGAGKTVLDIMKVKPGCIITDVARPLDLPPEDVAKRPDVLVIESGEIKLPGEPKLMDIGLPAKDIVYACLAETIVLAMEGRYETYTIGRNIEWEKVREIYRLGLKHGMNLAAISGVNGMFTDDDILRVKELAIAAREKQRKEAAKADAPEPVAELAGS